MKTFHLLSLGLALTGSLLARETTPGLTLAQVLDSVLAHYPSIAAARDGIDAARARTQQSRSARLPQLSADASYRFVDPLSYIDFSTPDGTRRIFQQTHDNYDAALNLRQLVTDFGRTTASVSLARSGEVSAQDSLVQIRNNLGYQAIQYFYAILYLRESAAVADQELLALQEALRITQQKFSAGTATKFDLLTTQVRLANAENRRTDILAALRRQEARLRPLLSADPATPVIIVGTFPASDTVLDRSALYAEALRVRPELKLAHDAEQTAQLKFDSVDRADRPAVNATLSGGTRNGYAPSLNENKPYVGAGVALSVPILTGRRTDGQRRESRADLRAAQNRTQELERVALGDLDSSLADLAASQSHLTNSDTLVAQAQEALALAQSRYERGVVTNFELLDAQSAARAAELSRLQARYDCVMGRQLVARAIGREPAP